ncbi:hypothetical protein HY994_05155 [Candidatus Micrarchaeota archaeon]|nr:hypothetical protein [Candidatus Micrarchaeota archaeon]
MVSNNRFAGLSLFLLFSLMVFGCTQPPSGPTAASPTALPTVTAVPAKPTVAPSVAAAATPKTPTPTIAYIASVKPSVLPTDAPKPTLAAGIPLLTDFVRSFNRASNQAFNDSRVAYESSTDVWAIEFTSGEFQYSLFIRPSKARNWGAFDVVKSVYGASGTPKNVSLTEGESGPYYKYALSMKCFDAHYDVDLTLLDFAHVPGTGAYRRTLGPAVMLTLADACPN